jgi:hypothetical protein
MASSDMAPQTDPIELTTKAHKKNGRAYREGQRVILMHLSDELLVIIAESLDDGSPCDLLHLAMCSRRLHTIAEPLIYRDFWQKGCYDTDIVPFMCRIVARPDLARQVRSFRGYVTDSLDLGEVDLPDIRAEDLKQICAAVQGLSGSEPDAAAWVKEIENREWDAIVTLILSLLPNLQELDFEDWWPPCNTDDELPRLIRLLQLSADFQNFPETSPSALINVHRASVQYCDTEIGMPIEAILPFLNLRSITSFAGTMIAGESLGWFTPRISFSIKELSLKQSVFDPDIMTKFLRCFPFLGRLYYEHGGASVGDSQFEPPRMMAALEHLKPCLEELTIFGNGSDGYGDLSYFPLGSLADFQKLTSIVMSLSVLLGRSENNTVVDSTSQFKPNQRLVEAIPPRLQSLALRDEFFGEVPWREIKDQIVELITDKQIYAPELKYLDIEWEMIEYPDKPSPQGPFVHKGFTKDEADRLLAQCEAAGVEMIMKVLPPKPKYVTYNIPVNGKFISTPVSHMVLYPYTEYETLCEEHGCDPATGRPRQ